MDMPSSSVPAVERVFGALRTPREVVFGEGQRFALGILARQVGARALVCTDARMSDDQAFARLLDNLQAHDVTTVVFDRTIAELPLDNIHAAVDHGKATRPDVVIGIGGGSCLDLAKLVALLLTHGGSVQDYYGEFRVPGPIIPIIAVPTTAGTGSEATPVAVLADPDRSMKVGVSSPYLIPTVAICDPELSYTCPPRLTASTGADALTHAIEAFTAVRRPATAGIVREYVFIGKNTLSDYSALRAITLIARHLRRAVQDGSDAAARSAMMLGSFCAGTAFGTAGTAAAHAIQYPVGALTHTPHGLGVASLLPYVMEFNKPACVAEFAQVADAFGVGAGEPAETRAARAIDAVDDLFRSVGIPHTLADLGLAREKASWVAEQALTATRLVNNNPRPLNLEAMERIVHAALTGERSELRES
jgi:alcohol dehydrogenase